jgi:predicted GH43/DUF377 family glycosyl hydrolase
VKYFLPFVFVVCPMNAPAQGQSEWAQWTKQPQPVYESADSTFAASDPSVVHEDDSYYLYYTDVDNSIGATVIALATSKDGLEWSYQGRLLEANKSNWDAAHESAAIWKEEDKPYHLFYIGYQPKEYPPLGHYAADLGVALSENAEGDFEKPSDAPLLLRSSTWYDSDMIASPDIIKVGKTYYMVYAGHCYENCQVPVLAGVVLLGATSSDLVHWTKHETPVLGADPNIPWMAAFVAEPALLAAPNGKYYLFFTAFADWESDHPVIGLAEGETPFGPWNIKPEPILESRENWESAWVGAPDVLLEENTVKMWYMAVDKEGYYRIGYATAPWPLREKE